MRKRPFGQRITASDVESLPGDGSGRDFVRLCGAVIAAVVADRFGPGTVPEITERILVPDGGVDAQYVTPKHPDWCETHGLIGPGRTVFQFKYRDLRRANRPTLIRELTRRLQEEFPRVAPSCDRYVLLVNLDLVPSERQRLTKALRDAAPDFSGRPLIWGAAEVALAINAHPHLRHLFFAESGLCTLDFAEEELKAAYLPVGWPAVVGRDIELAAIQAFLRDPTPRLLEVFGPQYVGKSRLVIEALRPVASEVVWAASPDAIDVDLLRELDSTQGQSILIVDRCTDASAWRVAELALERRILKTIVVRSGSRPRVGTPGAQVLALEALSEGDATRLATSMAPGLTFMEQSWVARKAGGLPGLILHLAEFVARRQAGPPGDVGKRVESLVAEKYLTPVGTEARRSLQVLALLQTVGIRDEVVGELDAVARALETSGPAVRAHIPALQGLGLVRRRGDFVEVLPSVVADQLAAEALASPERLLAELQLALSPPAFLRFLQRLREVPLRGVERVIGKALAGWIPDLEALVPQARYLTTLAPAAPEAAVATLERVLAPLNVEDLRDRIKGDPRRAIVSTLEALALRSSTFAGAARLLLALAEAENETWGNNATGVFCTLFDWRHPEVAAPVSLRVPILAEGAESPRSRAREIVAKAAGQAIGGRSLVTLHDASGPDLPERPGRPATWDQVRNYEFDVLRVLETLGHDPMPGVRREAQDAVIGGFRELIGHSILPDGLHPLGIRAFAVVDVIATEAPSASRWAAIVTQLELLLDDLTRAGPIPATKDATERASRLKARLTEENLTARLWHWVGPGSHGVDLKWMEDHADVANALEALAGDLAANPKAFAEHLLWLVGDEAKHRVPLFRVIGERDRGGPLLSELLTAVDGPYWPEAFGAYCVGWASRAGAEVESTLDRLVEDARFHPGVIVATAWMPTSPAGVDRLIRLAGSGTVPKNELASETVRNVPWDRLTDSDAERLVRALDDGTPGVRAELLQALLVRDGRGVELTAALRDHAWDLLHSTSPVQQRTGRHTWDALAARLGKQEQGRLLTLVERLLTDAASGPELRLDDDLPLSWRMLQSVDRPGVLRMLLRLALVPDASWRTARQLSQMLEPARDRDVVLRFLEEKDGRAAALLAESLDPERDGFWELARELIVRSGGDEAVTDNLLGRLGSGVWSGSAVQMIDRRLEGARRLTKDPDSRVAAWASEAVRQLEEWRRREERQDEEGWIWDYRVPRQDLEAMLARRGAPERLWAIGRLLEDAPPERVSELLSPGEILEALPRLDHLDRRTREKWEAWARHRSQSD